MEISYHNTFWDIISFGLRNLFTRKVHLIIYVCFAFFITFESFKGHELYIATVTGGIIFFAIVLVLLYSLAIVLTILVLILSYSTRKDKGVLTRHTITFDANGLIEETPINRGETKWAGIYKITKGFFHIYIYEGPNRAHIIPKRIFKDYSEFQTCYDTINTLFKQVDAYSINAV